MIKPISICFLILTCKLAVFAGEELKSDPLQSKPDLSGTWMLDRDRSNVGKSSNVPAKDDELKITHQEPELKIRRVLHLNGQTVERELIYYTDGRGETNPATVFLTDRRDTKAADRNTDETKSRTRWSGNKLITSSIIRNVLGGHVVEYELEDEWKLSADGRTLTQTTRFIFQQDSMSRSVYIPSGRPDPKRVYSLVAK